jgi:hypothetical protein
LVGVAYCRDEDDSKNGCYCDEKPTVEETDKANFFDLGILALKSIGRGMEMGASLMTFDTFLQNSVVEQCSRIGRCRGEDGF